MSALYEGIVTHRRFSPKPHRLKYRVFSLLLDLEALNDEAAHLRLFSRNRFNLFSFHDRDYGDGHGDPLAWARAQMRAGGLNAEGSRIMLLTMPRLLGYAFNPIAVYFCYAASGPLIAILYEVNNTFGQRHSYFIPVEDNSGGIVRQSCKKTFYVSPFMDMDMRYDFILQPPAGTLRLRIAVRDIQARDTQARDTQARDTQARDTQARDTQARDTQARDTQAVVLTASFSARRTALNDTALLHAAVTYPLLTLKVVAGIHWEALLLWWKGLRLRARPAPPATSVSFTPDAERTI